MSTTSLSKFPAPNLNNKAFIDSTMNTGTAGTGVTADEYGDGFNHVTRLSFTNLTLGSPVGAANLAFGALLYTLPPGVQAVTVAGMNLAVTGTVTIVADTPDVGVGTVVASGANALLSGTATFENILTGQTSGAISGSNAINAAVTNQALTRQATDAKTIYLNCADGWAGAGTVTATGSVTLVWSTLNF